FEERNLVDRHAGVAVSADRRVQHHTGEVIVRLRPGQMRHSVGRGGGPELQERNNNTGHGGLLEKWRLETAVGWCFDRSVARRRGAHELAASVRRVAFL